MTEGSARVSPRALVHATAVALKDATRPFGGATAGAVLLLGASGAGKSDVALRLIAAGAQLIADDQTVLFLERDLVFADAPPDLSGGMEIRGLGILRVERAAASPIILAVRLDSEGTVPRMPEPQFYDLPASLQADVKVPLVTLNAYEASTPAKIAAAAAGLNQGAFVAGAFPAKPAPFI
jgi:serine kinase of HPr protein (carbohydrate metabolism regulator)